MLHISHINKSFGGVKAVDDVTCIIERGKVTALIGPNGAGKTTLFDILSGLIPPDNGAIIFNDTDITRFETHERANLGMSRTFQHVRLFKYLTVLDHLVMTGSPPYERVLHDFGIEKSLDTCVSDLSYGQRKLLQLAMAVQRPHCMLLLDEPVAGVNKVLQERIETVLLNLQQKGEAVLIIDHDMQFIRRLADRIIVMDAGKILMEGTPQEIFNDPRVLEAYLGE